VSGVEPASFRWDAGAVSGVWHHPPRGDTYVVLGHGAGGTLHTPGLAQFADALAARGVGAVRFNFPYAEAGRRVPDPRARLEACYRAVAAEATARAPRVFLGGRSMGGRIASQVAAAGVPAAGLIFLSYPLHPPGEPGRLRTAHLSSIRAPMLFLQGSKDSFALPDLLAEAVARLPTATLHVVEGADHGLRVRGRAADDVVRELADVATAWIAAVGAA
jgi:predicted alpha/beta-hydrolase family hydrolase